jgi:hypothetical protein
MERNSAGESIDAGENHHHRKLDALVISDHLHEAAMTSIPLMISQISDHTRINSRDSNTLLIRLTLSS